MKIIYVGDCHGKFDQLKQIISKHDNPIIQIGDMGLGFKHNDLSRKFPANFYFIRGNHDNPETCRAFPNYLGDFGYNKYLNLFYVSGAWSIDQNMRKEGVSWWREEELSLNQCSQVLSLWKKIKPDYVITHDGPKFVTSIILNKLGGTSITNRTEQLLNQMFEYHKPKVWIFGHYHLDLDIMIKNTRFICLAELEMITLDINN